MNDQRFWQWVGRATVVAAVMAAVGLCAPAASADSRSGPGFRFDFGVGWSTMDESFYSDARWSNGALVNVEEYWDVDFQGSGGPTFGAAFFYRFSPYVSLEVEGRGLYTEPEITTDYTIYWDWNDGRSLWNAYRGLQYDDAQMRTVVGSLNLVVNLTDRGPVRPFLSFGVSAFDMEIEGAFDTAYAYTYSNGGNQYLDFDYPVIDFESDANSAGVNAGVGADFQLNSRMAVFFMVKYYHAESKDVTLQVRGNYPELNNFTMEVDPSFWATTGGIKLMF